MYDVAKRGHVERIAELNRRGHSAGFIVDQTHKNAGFLLREGGVSNERIDSAAASVAAALRMRSPPRVFVHHNRRMPPVCANLSYFRPGVFIRNDLLRRMDDDELRLAIAHGLYHIITSRRLARLWTAGAAAAAGCALSAAAVCTAAARDENQALWAAGLSGIAALFAAASAVSRASEPHSFAHMELAADIFADSTIRRNGACDSLATKLRRAESRGIAGHSAKWHAGHIACRPGAYWVAMHTHAGAYEEDNASAAPGNGEPYRAALLAYKRAK